MSNSIYDPKLGQWVLVVEKSPQQLEKAAREAAEKKAALKAAGTQKRPEFKTRFDYAKHIMPHWSDQKIKEYLENHKSFGRDQVKEEHEPLSEGWLAQQRAVMDANRAAAQDINETLAEGNGDAE